MGIGNAIVLAHLFVVKGLKSQIILGMPWVNQGSVVLTHREDGQYITIMDDLGSSEVSLRVSPAPAPYTVATSVHPKA